jgi:TonB-dependent receptor
VVICGLPAAGWAAEPTEDTQGEEPAEEAQAEEPAKEAEAEAPTETFDESMVVVGVRASLTQAVEVKRESIPIVDALVAEDIGKFPDNNVVEAMQRIPGVQVTNRGGGEVSTVSIRGLADVTTTVNGRNIFTSSGRSVALADIPATLVNRVDVYKTRSPENIARGIAGGIDIQTHRPFDFEGYTFSAQARGTYGEQAGDVDPNVSFLVSNKWDTGYGEFGALLNVSMAKTNWLDQGVHAGAAVPFRLPTDPVAPLERLFPPAWEPGTESGLPFAAGSTLADGTPYVLGRDAVFQPHVQGERERPAANLSLQWKPNDTSEYMFEAFYNGYKNDQHNSLFFTFVDWWGAVDTNDPVLINPGTNVVRSRFVNFPYEFISGDVLEQDTDSFLYALAGKWEVGYNLELNSELVYQKSEFKDAFFALRMDKVSPRLFVDFNTGDGVPLVEFFDDPLTAPDESDLTDASQWNLAQLYDNGQKDKGDAFTWTLDGDMNVQWGPFYRFSFGVRYDDRGAEENSYFGPDLHCNDAPGCAGLNSAAFPGLMGVTRNHFDGQAPVLTEWAIPSQSGLISNREALRAAYGYVPGGQKVFENEFNIDETQMAGYVQADFSTQKDDTSSYVDGRIGFRALDQETDMSFPDPEGRIATASNSNSVILPSAMLRWGINEDLLARFSYAETFNLPTFPQLNPYINYMPDVTDIGYGTATGGNADLKPIESQNLDLSLEYYFAEGSVVYATWFKRDITNNIVDYRNVVQYNDPDDNPDRGLYSYVLSQPDNSGDATLDGWEFGATWFPELSGWLDGIGIEVSATILDSERKEPIQDEQGNVIGTDVLDIMGVSKKSYSAILAYDRDTVSARLSYFWRDDFHDRDEAALFANPIQIWKSAEESLDFQATWYMNDTWAVTFDAVNLTAPVFHENYGDNPMVFNFLNNYYSRTFALGIRYRI